MSYFIKECNYFTFAIIENSNIYDIKNYITSEKNSIEITYDFNFHCNMLIENNINKKDEVYIFIPKKINNTVLIILKNQKSRTALVHAISRDLKLKTYNISISNNKYKEAINSIIIEENGEIVRVIQSLKDTKWIFYEKGTPIWFENIDYYKRKLIKNKLNKEIIIEYLGKLGFDVLDDNFWTSNQAVIIKNF